MKDTLEVSDDEFLKAYTEKLFKEYSNFLEYSDEDELIELTTKKTILVHFYSSSFTKCLKMKEALKMLSKKLPNIIFASIDVEKAPKMCNSLKIRVLPFLGFFKDGYFVDHLVGFEKIGNSDRLDIDKLEKYIKSSELFKEGKIEQN